MRPPRPRREAAAVALVSLALGMAAVAGASQAPDPAPTKLPLRAVQQRFSDLEFLDQASYRDLCAALDEIGRLRVGTGHWPAARELAEEWVPPFQDGSGYRWELLPRGQEVRYLGTPGDPARPTLLLDFRLDLSAKAAAARATGSLIVDGSHRTFLDGRVMHFEVWTAPAGRAGRAPLNPALEGWRQVVEG